MLMSGSIFFCSYEIGLTLFHTVVLGSVTYKGTKINSPNSTDKLGENTNLADFGIIIK